MPERDEFLRNVRHAIWACALLIISVIAMGHYNGCFKPSRCWVIGTETKYKCAPEENDNGQ